MDSITIKPSLRVPNLNFFIPGAKFVNSNLSLRLKFNYSKPKSSPISTSCKDSNSKPTKKQCNHSFYFAPVWAFAPFFHGIKDFLVLGTQRGNGFLRNAMGRRVFGLNNRGEPEKLLDEGNFDCLQSGGIGMAILSTTSMAKVRISPVLGTLAANPTFVSGLLAWATAQSTKVFLNFFVERKWDFKLLFNSGGMPSSHSALCTALTTSVALCHGIGDSLFPVCLGFSLIVMYDAIGVRRHAGMQAEVLNLIVGDLFQGHPVSQRKLKELLGHTPSQVIAGALLGILVACICCQGCLIAV